MPIVLGGDAVAAGVATSAHTLSDYLGAQASGYGLYFPTGDIYNNGGIAYNGATNSNSPITCGFAIDGLNLWARATGDSGWQGGGDPVAGTSPTLVLSSGTYFPACTPYNGTSSVTINAGQTAFSLWTPSGGFSGVS